ncbi:MAG: hypothetical protein AAGG38_04600 [Planctomycetota bacterium]
MNLIHNHRCFPNPNHRLIDLRHALICLRQPPQAVLNHAFQTFPIP